MAKAEMVAILDPRQRRADAPHNAISGSPTGELLPLSHQLRFATAHLHQQAEQVLDLPAMICDRRSYTATLDRFHGFHAQLEQSLGRHRDWAGLGLDLHQRSHAGRIARDLVALGGEPSPLPTSDLCPLTSFPHALGALYVMEGSTLGRRSILRLLEVRAIDIPPGAMSFFQGYGSETGAMWRSFVTTLDAFGKLHPGSDAAVQEGAQQAFRAVIAWFRPFCAQRKPGS